MVPAEWDKHIYINNKEECGRQPQPGPGDKCNPRAASHSETFLFRNSRRDETQEINRRQLLGDARFTENSLGASVSLSNSRGAFSQAVLVGGSWLQPPRGP